MNKRDLGRLFFCAFSKGMDENAGEKIAKYNLGGLLLSSSNMKDSFTLASTMNTISELKKRGMRFLVSSDNEGGQVQTVPNVPSVAGNMAMGISGDTERVYKYARMSGTIMKTLGLSAVFAPVLDLYYRGNSPVVGLRTFGSEPKKVAELGAASVKGYNDAGIMSCAKHFPGHGRAVLDSHLLLPTVDVSLEELLETDLLPFNRAVKAGVPAVMSAHILYPRIDYRPATLSERFLTGILREKLGHKGLIISDAIEMKAIMNNYNTEQILKGFFNSGGDMMILTTVGENIELYIDTLYSLVRRGEISSHNIESAMTRVEEAFDLFSSSEDIGFIYDIAREALEINVKDLKKPGRILLSRPIPSNMSLADTTARTYAKMDELARNNFSLAGIITYPLGKGEDIIPEITPEKDDLVIDIVIDSFRSENLINYHRMLNEIAGEVVYIIARDPADRELYCDFNSIVTNSTDLVSVGLAFEEIKKRLPDS